MRDGSDSYDENRRTTPGRALSPSSAPLALSLPGPSTCGGAGVAAITGARTGMTRQHRRRRRPGLDAPLPDPGLELGKGNRRGQRILPTFEHGDVDETDPSSRRNTA